MDNIEKMFFIYAMFYSFAMATHWLYHSIFAVTVLIVSFTSVRVLMLKDNYYFDYVMLVTMAAVIPIICYNVEMAVKKSLLNMQEIKVMSNDMTNLMQKLPEGFLIFNKEKLLFYNDKINDILEKEEPSSEETPDFELSDIL